MKNLNQIDIIKYGTTVLTREDNTRIDHNTMFDHGQVISNHPEALLMISSGAMGFGQAQRQNFDYITNQTVRKQVLAMAGNPHLSVGWDQAISDKQVLQGLITERSFNCDTGARENVLRVLRHIYEQPTAAVVVANENDFESDDELTSSREGLIGDNDENVAKIISVAREFSDYVRATIITNSGGVRTQKGEGAIIKKIAVDEITPSFLDEICGPSKNGGSPKGMRAKILSGKTGLEAGADKFFITGGKSADDLGQVLSGGQAGTEIVKSHNFSEI